MRVIVERDALAPALDALNKVVARKNTIPILNHLKIEADDGCITLTAHALDYWMSVIVPAEVDLGGEAAVLADTLRSVVKGIRAGAQVSLTTFENRAEMRAGRSRYKLPVLPAGDFPEFRYAFATDAAEFKIDGEQVRTLLERPRFCTSTDDARFFLNGVFLSWREGKLCGIAADGVKGFGTAIPAMEGADRLPSRTGQATPGVIIPTSATDRIVMAVSTGGTITVDSNKILACSKSMSFGSKLIDQPYPDFWRFLPKRASPVRFVADRAELIAALARLQAVAEGDSPRVRVAWKDGDEEVRLTLSSTARGEGEEALALFEPATGDHMAEYAPGHMVEMLGASRSERVEYARNPDSMTAWVTDPNDAETISVIVGMTPIRAEHAHAG